MLRVVGLFIFVFASTWSSCLSLLTRSFTPPPPLSPYIFIDISRLLFFFLFLLRLILKAGDCCLEWDASFKMDCRRLSEPPANIYRLVSCDAILISRLLVTTDASDSFRVVVQRALARRQKQQKKGEKVLPSGFSFLIINTLQHNKGQRQYSSFHQYQLTFHVALSSSSSSPFSLSPSRPKLERRSSFPRLLTPGPHHPLGYCETRLRRTLFSLTLNQVQHSQQQVSSPRKSYSTLTAVWKEKKCE